MLDQTKLTREWSVYDHQEGYEKQFQDVKLKNGDILNCCWPNAGLWSICDSEGNEVNIKKYKGKDIPVSETTHVRLTHNKRYG